MRTGIYFVLAVACGCGYVGNPLPPAVNIPQPVKGLSAVQVGDRIVVDFTQPDETTEGLPVKKLGGLELRVGKSVDPFDANTWAAGAKPFVVAVSEDEDKPAHTEIPVADFAGQDVVVGVRSTNPKGRASGWSNFVSLHVAAPPQVPVNLKAVSDPKGARLTWEGKSPAYRVLRKSPGDKDAAQVGEPAEPAFLDETAEYDKKYQWSVVGVDGGARSAPSAVVEFTPVDAFAPESPAGLTAIIGASSVELAWESNSEPDLKGYRVYRSVGGGEFELIGESAVPAYSDKKLQAGKRHSYVITAVDKHDNESARSAPAVEVEIP